METLSLITRPIKEIRQRIKKTWEYEPKPFFESLDPDKVYIHLARFIGEYGGELNIYRWDPEVDDREGMKYALQSALMKETPHLKIKAIFEESKVPQLMSELVSLYGNRILIREKSELKLDPFKLINPFSIDELAVELVRSDEEGKKRLIYKGLFHAGPQASVLKKYFDTEFYS